MPEYRTVGGLSNISFGLPMRSILNRTFLAMSAAAGIDALICDPTDRNISETIRAAEALTGIDPGCKKLLKYYRKVWRDR
jgi:5-methyltetrahydrofolate--homocysteine methyltransferase